MKRERLTIEDPPAVSYGANGRLSGGRFGPGNKAAVGRGRAAAEWYEAARAAVPPETLRAIFVAAAKVALRGDVVAARFCAEYTVGKPHQRVDLFHDGDGDPSLDPGDDYFL